IYILPTIVFFKNKEMFEIPLWIPILYAITSGIVFIIIIISHIRIYFESSGNRIHILDAFFGISLIFGLPVSHMISDLCFLFYTRTLLENTFTEVFIYLHAVSGILTALLLFFTLGTIPILNCIVVSLHFKGPPERFWDYFFRSM